MKTVLVVDDEPFIADVIAMALEDGGYTVVAAANGKEGLTRLAEAIPDLIITDHMMPVMDGPAMVRGIRSRPEFDGVPVILMSALPYPPLDERCPGASYFIQKPFRTEEILRLANEALGEAWG